MLGAEYSTLYSAFCALQRDNTMRLKNMESRVRVSYLRLTSSSVFTSFVTLGKFRSLGAQVPHL